MGILSNSKVVPLSEIYFGTTPGVKAIEQQLGKFRRKYMADEKTYMYDSNCMTDPMKATLEDMICAEFGFGSCYIAIKFTDMYNAMTFPIGIRWDVNEKNYIHKTKTGYRYDKKADYAAFFIIYAGLIFNPKFTDKEVIGILLHEIGHNFQTSVNVRIGTINYATKVTNLIITVLTFFATAPVMTNFGMSLTNKLERYLIKEYPNFSKARYQIGNYIDMYQEWIKNFNLGVNLFTMFSIPSNYLNMAIGHIMRFVKGLVLNPLSFFLGYPGEQFSDDFATMYGYGPDLHSGMGKMQSTTGGGLALGVLLDKGAPWYTAMYNMFMLPMRMLTSALDVHPVAPERSLNTKRVLENEFKYANPKMKKRIKEDLDRLEKAQEQYYKYHNRYKQTVDPMVCKKIWYTVILKMNGDLKHYLFDPLFANDKAFRQIDVK